MILCDSMDEREDLGSDARKVSFWSLAMPTAAAVERPEEGPSRVLLAKRFHRRDRNLPALLAELP